MKKAILACLIIMMLTGLSMKAEQYYWQYWPFEPLTIHSEVLKVQDCSRVVKPGEVMRYQIDFTKHMDVLCTVKRELVNGYIIHFDPIEPPQKEIGVRTSRISGLVIPRTIDDGLWKLRSTWECGVGPNGRKISMTRESEPFRVRK